MAKIRDFASTILATAATSAVCEMPEHQTGDLLVAFVSKDGTATVNTPANWSATAAVGASVGAYGGVWTRRAQSAAEAVTFTTGTSGAWSITIISISNTFGTATNGSDALSVAATIAATDSTAPYTGGTITPAHANCLVLAGIFTDATFGLQPDPGWVTVFTGDSGANSIAVAYTVEDQASVAVTGPNWYQGTGADDDTRAVMIAIRDSGTLADLDCYIDRATPPSYRLAGLYGSATGDTVTYLAANGTTLTSVLVNGTTSKTSTGLATTSTADSGYNPYRSTATTAGSSSTTNLGHSEFTSTFNMTQGTGLFFGVFRPTIPRDYIDLGKPAQGGVYINFTNGTTANARAWVVGGQFSQTTKQSDYNPFVIQVQQTNNTAYAWNGTVTWSNVSRVGFGSSSFYGAASVQWSNFFMLNKAVLVGGTQASPFDIDDVVRVVNNGSGYIPLISKSGSTITSFIPIQFGGVDRCNVTFDLATIQFPKKADKIDFLDFHVDNNVVGLEFYGTSANDNLIFKNTVFTSESPYYWRFNASASASAFYNFEGSSVINSGLVTLRNVTTFNNMSFIDCPDITQNSALITNCLFDNSYIKSNNLSNIQNCQFISDGVGHAIEITTAGTYSFSGNTFTSFGASGTTDAAIYNNSGGAVTINVSGGGSVPTIRNGTGASTNVVAAANVTLTGLQSGSEVRAYVGTDPSTSTEIGGTESSGTSFNFSQSVGGQQGYIVVHALGYNSIYLPVTYSGSDVSIPIQQVLDRTYNNP